MVASFVVQLLGIISILIGGIMMYFAFLIKKAGKVQEAIVVEDIEEPISEEEKPEK